MKKYWKEKGQILYIYDRKNTSWEQKKQYQSGRRQHGLMLGGIPSTEISAIVLRDPHSTFEKAKQEIVNNGFYIPIYDLATQQLLFTKEQYNTLFNEMKPYKSIEEFMSDTSYISHLDKQPAGAIHKFNLKEHLVRTTHKVIELAKKYNLSSEDTLLVA